MMIQGKSAYLKKLTTHIPFSSIEVGKELEGSSPPSVFVGSWNYPKVYAGPMITPQQGDTAIMDRPESWIPEGKSQSDILGYRLNLVRGKRVVKVNELDDKFVDRLQDIVLAFNSVDGTAKFDCIPKGMHFSDESAAFGPSAPIERFEIENVRWNQDLEKVYYDYDLKASEAVVSLHDRGLNFSSIQKAFSMGTMGLKRRRRLVPTRWSITACDNAIGTYLLNQVKEFDILDCFKVYEFSSLNNYYAIILLPTVWQYEWMEAFLHIMGQEELLFSDFEYNCGKRNYSSVGGCYYACKMAVLEGLKRQKIQAGSIVLREAHSGYIPMGVFNVRENVRNAMFQRPIEFADLRNALEYLSTKLQLPLKKFEMKSNLLKESLNKRQTTLDCF